MIRIKLPFVVIATLLSFASSAYAGVVPLRLHLTYYPTVEFAGIFLAKEKGWYRDAGIDLQIKFIDLNITENLLADKVDIAMHSGHEVIRQVANGAPINAFAAEYQFNPLSLMADKSIEKLTDLKGKTIGIFTEQEKDFIKVMFKHENMTLDDVKFVQVPSFGLDDLVGFVRSKRFDAIPVWEFNHPVGFALKGLNTRQFPSSDYGFHFYGTVFYAKKKTIESQKIVLANFIKVTRRGWAEAYRTPEKTVRHFVDVWYPRDRYINGDKKLTYEQQLTQFKLSQRYLYKGVGEAGFGQMTEFQWASSVKIAKANRLINDDNLQAKDVYTDAVMKTVAGDKK